LTGALPEFRRRVMFFGVLNFSEPPRQNLTVGTLNHHDNHSGKLSLPKLLVEARSDK
jgi:hypothetical protein